MSQPGSLAPVSAAVLPANATQPIATAARTTRARVSLIRWSVWLCCALAGLVFLWQPVSAQAQLMLGLAVIAVMALVGRFTHGKVARWTFIAAGSFVILRYIYWRATQTLPDWDDPAGFGFGALLVLAEMYCVFVLAVSLIINADPLERPGAPLLADDDLPDVDIFIPTYNEDAAILAMTASAARAMDYPPGKLKVWLLDDGGTDQKCADIDPAKAENARARRGMLQKLCNDLGLHYLARAKNVHAKAGNLNNGLQNSKAPIVVVFDADHAPFRSFLRETIGYFAEDPKLFLVQTPHVFLNPDPIEKNLRTFEMMPSENEMFYSVTQRGLDKWNGSFFCGSAALLRRAALETTGGFSGITITEDCETAFDLHGAGWTSVYVDKPLIAGLQPETFASFIGQRSRWCQGMFQLLLLKNPVFKPGLSLIQRLAYLSSMTYWFFPLPRLIFMIAPLLHIFFDVKIFVSTVEESIAYAATYFVVNLMIQNRIYGHVRWPWMSELYEYVQGVYLAKAIVQVILSPRKPTFNVTAKGLSLTQDHLSELAMPFVIIFLGLLSGVLMAAWRYMFEPGVTNLMLVVGLWALFNLVIAGVALGVVAERRDLERNPRLAISRRGRIAFGEGGADAAIESVSAGGCLIQLSETEFAAFGLHAVGTKGRLSFAGKDAAATNHNVNVVVSRISLEGGVVRLGLAFDDLATHDYIALADLMYGDADCLARFLKGRRTRMGILRGTWMFLTWSVTGPARALYYGIARRTPAPVSPDVTAPAVALVAVPVPPVVPDHSLFPLVADAPLLVPDTPANTNHAPINEIKDNATTAPPKLWAGEGLSLAELESLREYLGILAVQKKLQTRVA